MTFGDAVERLKTGQKVARAGWNGKGMFLFYVGAWAHGVLERDEPTLPFIAMKTATNELVPWLASQTDILSEDWEAIT